MRWTAFCQFSSWTSFWTTSEAVCKMIHKLVWYKSHLPLSKECPNWLASLGDSPLYPFQVSWRLDIGNWIIGPQERSKAHPQLDDEDRLGSMLTTRNHQLHCEWLSYPWPTLQLSAVWQPAPALGATHHYRWRFLPGRLSKYWQFDCWVGLPQPSPLSRYHWHCSRWCCDAQMLPPLHH